MRNPQGYATITYPEGTVKECDTFSCSHCNRIVHMPVTKKIEQVGDFCRSCMKMICAECAEKRICSPFLKKLEIWDNQDPSRALPFDALFPRG